MPMTGMRSSAVNVQGASLTLRSANGGRTVTQCALGRESRHAQQGQKTKLFTCMQDEA
jgi:hypothetical protein